MYKKRFILLVGLPTSGKSTFVKRYLDKYPDTRVISNDDILEEMYPDLSYNEAWIKSDPKLINRIYNEKLQAAYRDNSTDVIVDAMNHTKNRRRKNTSSINKNMYEIIAINFPIDRETFIERNKKRSKEEDKWISMRVFDDALEMFEEVDLNENFDKVVNVEDFEI